ncbi:MAG: iron-containing alcohol dehydrogenase [Euryarchaeota archaeon]|nr:iron-containing alcohol dehydrogenase [Euryarchaeota archaeon]
MNNARLPVRKFATPEIIFGSGSIELVGQHASNLSHDRVLIVSDPGVRDAGWVRIVENSLEQSGLEHTSFDQVKINPRIENVEEGVKHYLDENCDLIVAVGGGSPIDCAKCIGVMATNEGSIEELEGVDEIQIPGPPLLCVPTTAGSSADISPFAIITDREAGRKMVIISRLLVPDLSIVDPDTTTTMDSGLTVSSGIDALAHALESYVSTASSPLTDMFALEAAKIITNALPRVHLNPLDMRARERMMLASLYAGLSFSNASLGILHAMSHGVGGMYDTTHGVAACALLEIIIEFNYPCVKEKYIELENAMFKTTGGMETLISHINRLLAEVGADQKLRGCGLRKEDILPITEHVIQDPCLATNPRPARRIDIEELYERAL